MHVERKQGECVPLNIVLSEKINYLQRKFFIVIVTIDGNGINFMNTKRCKNKDSVRWVCFVAAQNAFSLFEFFCASYRSMFRALHRYTTSAAIDCDG
jgi:hypothetical protein